MGVKSTKTTEATISLAAEKMAMVFDKLNMSEEEKNDQAAEMMKDFIDRIAGEDSELDHAELLKMHEHGKQLGDMLGSDDPKMKPLQDATLWALGKSLDGRDLESKRGEVTETLKEALKSGEDRKDVAAMILALMNANDQADILEQIDDKYIAKKMVSQGYTTPLVLKDAGYEFGKDEWKGVEDAYNKNQKSISGAVRGMQRVSIGAGNYANDTLTLKNGLRTIGYVMGGTTILMNAMASWKNPSSLLTNEYFGLGLAQVGAAYYTGSDRKFLKDIQPKSERDLWKADKNERILFDEINRSTTGWAEFFEFQEGEALSTLWKFIGSIRREDGKLPLAKLNIAEFKKFMYDGNYEDALAAFKELEKKSGTMNDRSFVRIASAFDNLTIGGTALDAKLRYEKVLKEAKERKA